MDSVLNTIEMLGACVIPACVQFPERKFVRRVPVDLAGAHENEWRVGAELVEVSFREFGVPVWMIVR